MLPFEPADEIYLQVCDKLFVNPKQKIDNHNIGIEVDVTYQTQGQGFDCQESEVGKIWRPNSWRVF